MSRQLDMTVQDIYDLPVYVINLDRRADRWSQFQDLSGIGVFKNLRRWSATDGKTLDISGDERISLRTRYNIGRNMRRSHHEINTPGAIGASLSHYRVWADMLAGGAPGCIVFEDDVYLDPEVIRHMRSTYTHAPAADMFLFGNAWIHEETPYEAAGQYMRIRSFNGAHAYYISRRCAEIMVANFFPIEQHVEFYVSLTAKQHDLVILRSKKLDVKYMTQITAQQDSDTFMGDDSCPLCFIPDRPDGVYLSGKKMVEMGVAVAVLLTVTAGYIIGSRKA
jgi:GR25 family glycosyltransferase involved in LPS biosynthesis